ncbi:MAG: hypothetical protein KatS3mg088_470 [Patescibacteria group bacterium]|nr:MAG: hypothetical protein KatS3mg088_470 [Patescibacteria group bacterium]
MVKRIIVYLSSVIFILVSFYFIFTTSPFVRYWVDDFCSAAFLKNNGFWGAQIGWWKSWTGRYSAVFFTDIFESIGPWVVKFLPILILFLLSSSFYKVFKNIVFTFLFVVILLVNAPNIVQSFYWQTGSLNYTAPFIFLGIFLSQLFSDRNKSIFLPFILMFVAGGFSEAFALGALVFLFFALLVSFGWWPGKVVLEKRKIIIAGLVGVLLSLVLMSFSPGNVARGGEIIKQDKIFFVIKSSILGTKWFLFRMLSIKTFIFSLFSLFIFVYFIFKKPKFGPRRSFILIFLSLLAIVFTTMAVLASGFYAMGILPPERALFVATSMILGIWVFISWVLSGILSNYLVSGIRKLFSFVLILFLPLLFASLTILTFSHWKSIKEEVRSYALSWDKEVNNLPKIRNIRSVGGLDSFTDNKGWVSSCVANYFGYKEIEIIE